MALKFYAKFDALKASDFKKSIRRFYSAYKIHLYSVALMGCIIGFCVFQTLEFQTIYSDDSIRLPSLTAPKVVKTKKSEQNVLLNDPAISKNWGLLGTGGVSDISVDKAWNITQGSRDVVVAVIDTGIDENHPDLKNNLWVNKERSLSSDKYKCRNDLHGCNFISETGDLTDNHGHGTHIAGIVGAEGGNGIGISGVSPKVSLMILKYYDPRSPGTDNLKNTVKAIHYAIDHGAQIINYSGGGLDFSREEYEAIKRARDRGILFVAAAGNEKSNSDQAHYYPANYDLDNIISVTAVNPQGNVLQSSNYGINSVHLAAPGEKIYSTLPGGRYGEMTGTSQATAFVTGVAALLKANNSDMDYKQIKKQIIGTADARVSVFGKTQTSGILNSWAALAIHSTVPANGVMAAQNQTAILTRSPIVDGTRIPALSDQLSQINQLLDFAADSKNNLN